MKCPDEIYQIMLKTWSENASERPSFQQILETFEQMEFDSSEFTTDFDTGWFLHFKDYNFSF